MALSSLVFLSVRGKRSSDYIFVIFPPWIAVACVCVYVFLFFFCVNIGFSFLLLLLNGSVGEKKKSDVQCNISPNQSGLVQKRVYDDAQELCLKHTKYDMEPNCGITVSINL